MKFVDIHSHMLAGIDDGPTEWEESVEMARIAANSGTGFIIATPHGDSRGFVRDPSVLSQICFDFNKNLIDAGIPVTFKLGMECPLEMDIDKRIDSGEFLTLAGSKYILVELPFSQFPLYVDDALFKLQLQGLTPIIAHPERQEQIQANPSLLVKLIERGVLAQLTGDSLVGTFGGGVKKLSEEFLRNGLVHIIASDAHRSYESRTPDLLPAWQAACRIVGESVANTMMVELPTKIADIRL